MYNSNIMNYFNDTITKQRRQQMFKKESNFAEALGTYLLFMGILLLAVIYLNIN